MHFRICCATILVIFCPLKNFVMHRHITYYTPSTSARVDSASAFPQINFSVVASPWAYAGFANGANFLGACVAWRSQAFARGVRGHASQNFFLEWCNLVRFGAYFHKFFTSKKSRNVNFLYKNNEKL